MKNQKPVAQVTGFCVSVKGVLRQATVARQAAGDHLDSNPGHHGRRAARTCTAFMASTPLAGTPLPSYDYEGLLAAG
jgi:hypothetical protein